jgi:inner membrane protein
MALPIVHATAGYLIYRLERRGAWQRPRPASWQRALGFMALANLPDADFLLGFVLGHPGTFHRGVSHTVLAAFLVGAGLATLTWWRRGHPWWPSALVFTAVYGSHLFLDAWSADARAPSGAAFFWPLSDAYFIFPIALFTEIFIDGHSRSGFLTSILRWETVLVLAREAVIALAVLAVFILIEARTLVGRRGFQALAPDSGEEDLA